MNLQNIADVVLPKQRPYPKKIYIFVYVHALFKHRQLPTDRLSQKCYVTFAKLSKLFFN